MASSWLGRLFGRGRASGSEDAQVPGPRQGAVPGSYDPPTSYGRPAPFTQQMPYGSGTAEPPVVARGRLAEATRRRRAIDDQFEVLERFEAKLSAQIHEAEEAERHDYAREVIYRRLSVRARLEEVSYRRGLVLAEEERLSSELARQEGRWPAQPVR